jgi:hypothetical protein
LASDYTTLEKWWRGHNAVPVHRAILPPDGWIAHACGVEIAASFLYVAVGRIAVIEFTTTNPQCALSRDLVEAVRGLYERLEIAAREAGCVAVISFVDPDSWERRTMAKMGYTTSADAKPHLMFAKPLAPQEAVA